MISIICPSPKGSDIAFKLQKSLNANLYIKGKIEDKEYDKIKDAEVSLSTNRTIYRFYENFKLKDITEETFKSSDSIIFISSTGIAVRAVSSFIVSKDVDPGVVVVDLSSKYAISLLSGHLGGSNELTLEVSRILNCHPIITTATDTMNIKAPDIIAKNHKLIIDDLKKAKCIAALLVDGKEVGIKDEYGIIDITKGYKKLIQLEENSIWITNKINYEDTGLDFTKVLKLIKRDIVLGIGCRRNTPYEKIKEFVLDSLRKYNYDFRAVNKIVSVDLKQDEDGIIKLAENFECPFITYKREEIKLVEDKYEKSEFVFKTLGVYSVCEPCVDLSGAEIVISKIKHEGMTLAIGILKS